MSITAGMGKLKRAEKDLRMAWLDVRAFWRDENSRLFEQRYIAPLLTRLRTVEATMGEMANVIQKVRRDCE